LDLVFFLFLK